MPAKLMPFSLFYLCVMAAVPSQLVAEGADFVSLFDGKNLGDWDGDPRFWRVENGELVGETTADKKAERNTFLIYRGRKYSDFELVFQYQVTGYNSGIQYRSRERNKWTVVGYQADFESRCHQTPRGMKDRFSGMLYDERGRTFLARRGEAVVIHPNPDEPKKPTIQVVGSVGNADKLEQAIHRDDWNEMRLLVKNHQFTHIINGHVMAMAVDEDHFNRVPSGLLAFQLHAGPAMKIRIRNVRIREIKGRGNGRLQKSLK